VNLTEDGRKDGLFLGFDEIFPVFQWHGDTFEIPEGAIKLAESKLCSNQAFRSKNAYGIQFHLEVTPKMLEEWIEIYKVYFPHHIKTYHPYSINIPNPTTKTYPSPSQSHPIYQFLSQTTSFLSVPAKPFDSMLSLTTILDIHLRHRKSQPL
jgi:hypothetical protein